MSEWKPIETAPRDGTRVRLGHDESPQSMKVETFSKVTGAYHNGQWELSAFFMVPHGRMVILSNSPTHWMPLPLPPVQSVEEG